MAGGSKDYDPEYIPAPSFQQQTTDEWKRDLKKHTSPLRGLAVDPAYPPSKEDAERVLQRMRKESKEKTLAESEPQPTFSAQDSRQPIDPYRKSNTSRIFTTAPTTDEVINTMPGGTALAAGSGQNMKKEDIPEPTLSNALKTFQPSSFNNFFQIPCVREAFLQGGPAGAFVGGVSWIIQRPLWSSLQLGVGTFMAVTIAGYQYCQFQRGKEKEGMKAAVRIMEEKNEEKWKRREEMRAKQLKRREEEDAKRRAEEARLEEERRRRRSWFRFWAGRSGEREG
jgi:cytochrome c oxidase assembly protein subunit 20